MTEKLSSDLSIWTLLDVCIHSIDNNSPTIARAKGKQYRDSSLLKLWFLRYLPGCISSNNENILLEYKEVISASFITFLEKEPPEADLRLVLHDMKHIGKSHQLNVDTLIQLWENLYKRINTNFKTINLDTASSLLVPNDTSLSYINKIRAMVSSSEEDNANLTSYDLFLELVIRCWQTATVEADPKFQQKFSNRVLLRFSTKMWLTMNEMGIHNLVNILLVLYYLGDDRSLDRIENVLLTVPFAEITHSRRVAVFKGLVAVLIMFYGKNEERKNSNFPENFMKKFENSVGVDRFTGRQLIYALDTIFSASQEVTGKMCVIISPWMRTYLNSCTDNDRDVLLETVTKILEKYVRLKVKCPDMDGEVVRRIYQALDEVLVQYLNAEQEVDVASYTANLFLCLRQPVQGLPLVDTLFTNLILNNVRNPKLQLKIVRKLAQILEMNSEMSVIHVNNLAKALIKFMLIIDGPVVSFRESDFPFISIQS